MKTQKIKLAKKKELPKDVIIKLGLSGTYDDQPLFKDKVGKANHILKTAGIPRF